MILAYVSMVPWYTMALGGGMALGLLVYWGWERTDDVR